MSQLSQPSRLPCQHLFLVEGRTKKATDCLPALNLRARWTATGLRREKAALSSGCKAHPATAPAGSNRSSHGGNEMASGKHATNKWQRECAGRNASER